MGLGLKIKECREAKGMTQLQLAEAVGVDQAAISYYEKDFKVPSLAVAKRIATALGVTLDYLTK